MISGNIRGLMAALALVVLGSMLRADVQQLQQSFDQPPDDARIMFRWWWFGPAVTLTELEREMKVMKSGGIGGFEVQPTYPLALDGERPGLKNHELMSPEFLDALKFTAAKARELGLRMDLTLGSGWPYGGKEFSREEAAGRLETQVVSVPAGSRSVALPELGEGKTLMAALVGPANSGMGGRGGRGGGRGARGGRGAAAPDPVEAPAPAPAPENAAGMFKITTVENGQIQIPADAPNPAEVVLFVSGQTGMAVKRPAAAGDGLVIDHLAPGPIDKFITLYAVPALKATLPNPPYAIFCDSLEIGGENWTPTLLEEFKKRRGYDLAPLLLALVANIGPKTEDIRHDWMMTVTEMFGDNFNARFKKLAHDYGSRFRIQGYGSPPAALFSYASADLSEGEGLGWQTFDETRWASSASHLLGRPVTSSETWTWLSEVVFRARPIDMKAEADIHFLQGVNQLIGHGWPYTAEGAAYPGWSFYAAGAFSETNPWYIAMPEIAKYLQRVSQMMREGTPANDVLVFLPNSDAWASRNTSINAFMTGVVGGGGRAGGRGDRGGDGGGGTGNITGALLAAGYNLDYVDDQLIEMRGKVEGNTLAFGDVKYRAIVLPPTGRIMLGTMKKLDEFARSGGIVISVGSAPQRAPGYLTPEADTQAVQEIAGRLLSEAGTKTTGLVANASDLGATLAAKGLEPDVRLSPENADLGFVHRHLDDAELYFIANTSNQPVSTRASFRQSGKNAEQWDPMTGSITPARTSVTVAGSTTVSLDLPSYGSTIIVFSNRTLPAPAQVAVAAPAPLDLSTGWTVKFDKDGPTVTMDQLKSWTDDERTRAFSGVASYTKQVNVDAAMLEGGRKLELSFGSPTILQGGRGGGRFRAGIESPVREVAVVYVNGLRMGSAWAPPYTVDVTSALKAGANDIRIDVGNLALNSMAARGYPNYDLAGVRAKYGNRFDPQGLELIQTTPSGLDGPIKLEAAK